MLNLLETLTGHFRLLHAEELGGPELRPTYAEFGKSRTELTSAPRVIYGHSAMLEAVSWQHSSDGGQHVYNFEPLHAAVKEADVKLCY